MGQKKLCLGCMEKVEYRNGICPICGYSDSIGADPTYIQPNTILNNRYLIGAVQSVNGEGVTYLGYDQEVDCKVMVREYMPQGLCTRVMGEPTIRVNPERLVQYKALMAEFTELHKALARLRNIQICSVNGLFAENNTTYVVTEFISGMRLIDYLKDNAGELSWDQFSQMLRPFLTTINLLHNSGVVHRAICPDTIYVTDGGMLTLTDFSTATARTANAELPCEIFNGYAAPEQYSTGGHQGTWTDVYALCAVLYRTLTGSMPPSAISRMENDDIIPPAELNPNIPENVSNIIVRGMQLEISQRTSTINELVSALFDNNMAGNNAYATVQNNPYADDDAYDNYTDEYTDDYSYDDENFDNYNEYGGDDNNKDKKKKEKKGSGGAVDRLRAPLIVGVVLLILLIIVIILFTGSCSSRSCSSGSSSSGNDAVTETMVVTTTAVETTEAIQTTTTEVDDGDSIMPKLVGLSYETAKSEFSDWIKFNIEEVYSDDYGVGKICWQEFNEGESFDSSKSVKIQISLGPASVTIPDFAGKDVYFYCSELDDLNIPYEKQSSSTSSYTDGTVMSITVQKGKKDISSMGAGSEINLNEGYKVIVYYAYNPVVETEPETEPPTTETAPVEEEVPVEEEESVEEE